MPQRRLAPTLLGSLGRITILGILVVACGPSTSSSPDAPSTQDTGASGEAASETAPNASSAWFADHSLALGLDFQHHSGFSGTFFMPEIIGPGVALFDANDDGRLDIFAVNGTSSSELAGHPKRGDRLYLQQATGQFVDATEGSGLGEGYGMGCAIGDIDNDGDLDLYVTRYGADALYRNRGDGTFEDVTASAGIVVGGWSTSAGFFDFDNDGWLDLYVVRYVDYESSRQCSTLSGQPDYCGPLSFRGQPDVLLANRGDGNFEDISAAAGITQIPGRGLGLALEDFDGDGHTDVYVANDGEANQLWIHQGGGRFEERAVVSGVAVNLLGRREASMGVSVGDVNGDGHLDLFLTHLEQETNTLYLGSGNGAYEDRVAGSGLGNSSLSLTGFGTALFDGDLDGDLDLLVANGKVRLTGSIEPGNAGDDPLRRYDEPDVLYENLGQSRFVAHPVPGPLNDPRISRGLAVGDVDGDGDLDAVFTSVEGPLRLLLNEAPRQGHYLKVRTLDPDLRRESLGARIWLHQGEKRSLRTVSRTSSYLSAQPGEVHFGFSSDNVDGLTVLWPNGNYEFFTVDGVDRTFTAARGRGLSVTEPPITP